MTIQFLNENILTIYQDIMLVISDNIVPKNITPFPLITTPIRLIGQKSKKF